MSSEALLLVRRSASLAARAPRWRDAAGAGLLAFVLLTPLLASDGGYFPPAWSWSTLVLSWVAFVTLATRADVHLGRLELTHLTALLGLVVWIFLSSLWAEGGEAPVLEGQRALTYLVGALAFLLLARSATRQPLLVGTWAAIVAVCGYGLLTRLVPERLGVFDPIAGYRLSEPLGYWNALGLVAALGALIALGLAAHARAVALRAAAAASIVVLLSTLYFTFSRGAWIALGAGLAVVLALDPRRPRLLAAVAVAAPPAVAAVWLASRSPSLTREDALLADASGEGHRLALALAGLVAATAALTWALTLVERRLRLPRTSARGVWASLALLAAACLTALLVRFGPPPTLAESAWSAFSASPPQIEGNLNRRLFNLSGSGRTVQWGVAWRQFEEHPVLGSGAGSFERYWLQQRPTAGQIRDAHSLYLETLSELGPLGLALLVVGLGAPLAAALRDRREPLVAAAAGAYAAFILHAGIDWDWEMPAVTLAALVCAAAALTGRGGEQRPPLRRGARGVALAGTLAASGAALVFLVGNTAKSESSRAAAAGEWERAETQARTALDWAPWSVRARRQLGEAELGQGDLPAARRAFGEAISQDPGDWESWLDLARASLGRERLRAIERGLRLNPLSPELAEFRAELDYELPLTLAPPEHEP